MGMGTAAILFIVIGILIAFGSFVYAALNMKKMFQGKERFDTFFGRHIGSMIGMVVGGLFTATGTIILGVIWLNR